MNNSLQGWGTTRCLQQHISQLRHETVEEEVLAYPGDLEGRGLLLPPRDWTSCMQTLTVLAVYADVYCRRYNVYCNYSYYCNCNLANRYSLLCRRYCNYSCTASCSAAVGCSATLQTDTLQPTLPCCAQKGDVSPQMR